MKSTRMAMVIALAYGLPAAVAYAQTSSRTFTPSAYEYGNYDYYNASQPAAPAAPSARRSGAGCLGAQLQHGGCS